MRLIKLIKNKNNKIFTSQTSIVKIGLSPYCNGEAWLMVELITNLLALSTLNQVHPLPKSLVASVLKYSLNLS